MNSHRMRLRVLHCVSMVFVAIAGTAYALDVGTAAPPAVVSDQQLTIGSRSLRLPPGDWTYIAKGEGSISTNSGVNRRATHFTAYAMSVKDGQMRASVQVRMPVNSSYVNSWNDEPCKVDGTIFKDDFGNDFKFPECLVVYKRRSHLSSSGGDAFYGQAQQWVAAQNVKLPGPVYEAVYTRLGGNDFGVARVYLPVGAVAGDNEMIAWAKQLRPALQRLFENRDSQGALPDLPAR